MELWKQQAQFAEDVAMLINFIFKSGYFCTFSDAYRSPEMAALYEKEGKGIKDSQHCKRLAIDLNLFDPDGNFIAADDEAYEKFGAYWEKLDGSNRWGGHFPRKDLDHFERRSI